MRVREWPRGSDPRDGSGPGGGPAEQLAQCGRRAGGCVHAVAAPAADAAGDKPLLLVTNRSCVCRSHSPSASALRTSVYNKHPR